MPSTNPEPPEVDVVLPCRDEAGALAQLLPRFGHDDRTRHYRLIVVDNGSTDATVEVARAHGAVVVSEPRPGYGSAVHAGVLAARPGLVAVLDGDDSLNPEDLPELVALVATGRADLATGRRRPRDRQARSPWAARLGTMLVAAQLRRRGIAVHDIAPLRVTDRDALLGLGIQDRRSGYPLELLIRAGAAGWRIAERDVGYWPRAAGTQSKVSGSLRGSLTAAMDFRRVLRSAGTLVPDVPVADIALADIALADMALAHIALADAPAATPSTRDHSTPSDRLSPGRSA